MAKKESLSSYGILQCINANCYYGTFLAVAGVNLEIRENAVTSFIGPSGCGKSTLLRCYNRMNDEIEGFRLKGKILFNGEDLSKMNPVAVRRKIGIVFQKPNPFPKSIFENIAFGLRINNFKGSKEELRNRVEWALKVAGLFDEVKHKMSTSGMALSGGQQQRLCIARAIALKPEIVLMDEPCASLDPISTGVIEDAIDELKRHTTVIIVTHNMQQATRVSDYTAFFNAELQEDGSRRGYLAEYGETGELFRNPQVEATKKYLSGKFG